MSSEEKKTTRVICDSNIWYRVEAGIYTPPDDQYVLTATAYSLNEIGSTSQIADDPNLIQRVVKTIYSLKPPIIPVDPFLYAISSNESLDIDWDDSGIRKLLEHFTKLIKIEASELNLDDETKVKIRESSERERSPNLGMSNLVNQILPEIRDNIKKTTGKKTHRQTNTRELIKDFVLFCFNEYLKEMGREEITAEEVEWQNLEFFLCVTENYFKELEVSRRKMQPNDIVDWLNTMYVQPGDKYLTHDKFWNELIQKDPRIKDYLI